MIYIYDVNSLQDSNLKTKKESQMKLQTNLLILALAVITLSFMSCDNDSVSAETSNEITTFIENNYPGSRIIKIERESNRTIEADIIHDNQGKDVIFDLEATWLRTTWDVKTSDLPQAVIDILDDTSYQGYHIDDADFFETPDGNYYLLELEKGNTEIKVKVSEDGNVLS